MNRNLLLLKNLLLSTSDLNSFKFCKDKKKRGRIVGNIIGHSVLFLMLAAYCIANCIGYGAYGLTDSIPVLCALVISLLAFVFTLFKTNGYLFNFKEYDMLMSLPFKSKDIAACKFLYMYIKSLPWYAVVSFSMMIVYGVYSKASAMMYPIWIVLSMILPIIPMLASSFLGFLIAKAGSGFKNKTMVQTVFTILLIFACFGSRFFLEDMFRNNKTEQVMNGMSDTTMKAGSVYLPIKWFAGAVTELRLSDILLILGLSVVIFELVFIPVGRSYRKINSALASHAASGKFVMSEQKSKSLINTIAFKEFKRMTGSVTYMTNALIGQLMCIFAGIAVLFVDIDKLLVKMLQNAPLTKEMLYPAIPFIVYFFIGMVATTAFTPSLEGKNYWIVQSLPIRKRTLYMGKMLFNMYLTVPFALFAALTFGISFKASFMNTVLCMILTVIMCAFSTVWGCVCGIKHMRLDWENEVEVIKQGSAITIYMFPNMILTMALIPLSVYLGTIINANLVTGLMILIYSVLTVLSYVRVMALTKE